MPGRKGSQHSSESRWWQGVHFDTDGLWGEHGEKDGEVSSGTKQSRVLTLAMAVASGGGAHEAAANVVHALPRSGIDNFPTWTEVLHQNSKHHIC